MKRRLICVTVLAVVMAGGVVNGQKRIPSFQTQSTVPPTTTESFVKDVINTYDIDIELAGLAKTKASSSTVRDYAQHLGKDHQRALDEFRKYASKKNLALGRPAADGHGILEAKSGLDFDRTYLEMMVDDHHSALLLFERQKAAKLGDSELQSLIHDHVVTLRNHLERARDLQQTLH